MRKMVMIGGMVFIAFLVILISIPFIFKGALLEKTRTTINRNLNVNVEFQELRVSLIKDSPKASLMLNQISMDARRFS